MKIITGPETSSHVVDGVKVSGLVIHVTAQFGKEGGEVAATRRVHAWSSGALAGLPRVAKIKFDTAELGNLSADGRLRDVAIHELGHALGFGIVWRARKLVTKEGSAGLMFRGPAAMVEYARLLDLATPQPVPMDGGSGGDHWREKTFVEESMTTRLHKGSQPLSRLTAASLKDLGYVVDLQAADAFKLPVP